MRHGCTQEDVDDCVVLCPEFDEEPCCGFGDVGYAFDLLRVEGSTGRAAREALLDDLGAGRVEVHEDEVVGARSSLDPLPIANSRAASRSGCMPRRLPPTLSSLWTAATRAARTDPECRDRPRNDCVVCLAGSDRSYA